MLGPLLSMEVPVAIIFLMSKGWADPKHFLDPKMSFCYQSSIQNG